MSLVCVCIYIYMYTLIYTLHIYIYTCVCKDVVPQNGQNGRRCSTTKKPSFSAYIPFRSLPPVLREKIGTRALSTCRQVRTAKTHQVKGTYEGLGLWAFRVWKAESLTLNRGACGFFYFVEFRAASLHGNEGPALLYSTMRTVGRGRRCAKTNT